jgi:hypothetical protein
VSFTISTVGFTRVQKKLGLTMTTVLGLMLVAAVRRHAPRLRDAQCNSARTQASCWFPARGGRGGDNYGDRGQGL